ncbi:MAG TPA: DNA starvation/stationary phase protection protein [Candidatus Binatia bacterium]|jgi:starvation-inducible DNA-binding protein
MKPNIGLSDSQLQGAVDVLNTLLSDEYVLYTKTRNYHWNVYGPQFNDLHKFFEEQYKELDVIVDEVAERARALGGWAAGTLAEFLENTRLDEEKNEYPDAGRMLANLVADHESVVRKLRVDLTTEGMENFLSDLLERHEKMAWMLRAFLEGEGSRVSAGAAASRH